MHVPADRLAYPRTWHLDGTIPPLALRSDSSVTAAGPQSFDFHRLSRWSPWLRRCIAIFLDMQRSRVLLYAATVALVSLLTGSTSASAYSVAVSWTDGADQAVAGYRLY